MSAERLQGRQSGARDVEGIEGPYLNYSAAWELIKRRRDPAAMYACRLLLRPASRFPEVNASELELARESAAEAAELDDQLQRLHERFRRQRDVDDPDYWIGYRREWL